MRHRKPKNNRTNKKTVRYCTSKSQQHVEQKIYLYLGTAMGSLRLLPALELRRAEYLPIRLRTYQVTTTESIPSIIHTHHIY